MEGQLWPGCGMSGVGGGEVVQGSDKHWQKACSF